MARDSSLAIRRAVLSMLKAFGPLTTLVPSGRIYPATVLSNPVWPFTMYEARPGSPIRASCIDGMQMPFSISCYAKPRLSGSGAMIETAEDFAMRIAAQVAAALDGRGASLDTDFEARAIFKWTGSDQVSVGQEADMRRMLVNFRARVIS